MGTDRETIENYSKYAEKWANRKRTGGNPAHDYLSPQMYSLLPTLKGKNMLCIGSGTGEECDHLTKLGAAKVAGIDIALGLVDYAKSHYPHINFRTMDMEKLEFPDEAFDGIYSNLTFHYVKSWTRILAESHRVLKPGGFLLFSTHHPVKWGAEYNRSPESSSHILGYDKDFKNGTYIIHGDYLNPRLVEDTWFGDFKVKYYHRSLEDIMKDILSSRFRLMDFQEPKPIDFAKEQDPMFWAIHQKIPTFLIMLLGKS